MLRIELEEVNEPASEKALDALAQELGGPLPDEYRNFLLAHDGAFPEPNYFEPGNLWTAVEDFYSTADALDRARTFAGRIPAGLVPVAAAAHGDQVCVSVREHDRGVVYLWQHDGGGEADDLDLVRLADSFGDFLGSEADVRGGAAPAAAGLGGARADRGAARARLDARRRRAGADARARRGGSLRLLPREGARVGRFLGARGRGTDRAWRRGRRAGAGLAAPALRGALRTGGLGRACAGAGGRCPGADGVDPRARAGWPLGDGFRYADRQRHRPRARRVQGDVDDALLEPRGETRERGWELPPGEAEAVLALPPDKRCDEFVRSAREWKVFWILAAGDEMAVAGEAGELVPVWPHPLYALACARGQWERFTPEAVSLREWRRTWTPALVEQGTAVLVFQTPETAGKTVGAAALQGRLDEGSRGRSTA